MSTEPQRQIEKQLKAYAEKRRAEAGAPLELHQSTRSMLQAEVARKIAKSPLGGEFWSQIFAGLWPRVAFGICVLSVLMAGTWVFWPTKSSNGRMELAANVPSAQATDEMAARAPGPTALGEFALVEAAADRSTTAPSELLRTDTSLNDKKGDARLISRDSDLEKNSSDPAGRRFAVKPTPTAAPQNAERKSVENLTGSTERLRLNSPVVQTPKEAMRRSSDTISLSRPTATPVAQASYLGKEVDRLNYDGSGFGSGTQRFAQVSLVLTSLSAKAPGAGGVLTSFKMEQNGDRVRVIDKDGSTYVGHLQKTDTSPKPQIADGKELINEARKSKTLANSPATSKNIETGDQIGQDFFFRVVGTNRNLKQQVIFSGHLLANANSAEYLTTNRNTTGVGQLQVSSQNHGLPWLLNSRINGTALIGGSNIVQIQAVPVAP